MKNKLYFILFSIILIFSSCNNNLDIPSSITDDERKGSLSGVITYKNLENANHGGIIVTLDKTDGLRTAEVTRAAENKRSVFLARSLVGNTVTSHDGAYVFENLDAGTYTVYASSSYSKEKAVCTNVVVRAGENSVATALQLTATGNITGKITLDEGNSGNTGFLVFIAGTSYMAITDDAGNYTISDVPVGNGYQLVAMKNNVMHFIETDVVVNANSSTTLATNNFTSKELKATDGKDGVDGTSIVWLGSFDDESEIENPQYLNAYFNMKDGCSYIYDGTKWTLLSAKGDKGDSGADGKNGEDGSNGTNGKDALAIGTVLSTEELTNQNVIITVNITQADISKIGYVYSSDKQNWNTANSILTNSGFISIQPDSNGKYQVVADKNGYYAFAVKNSDGYSAFTEEYITNIDKTAPGPVSNLIAKYNKNTKVLSVTWTNSTDRDFDYAVLGYTKGDVTVTSNVMITNGTYTLSDVEVDGEEYVFTVYAKDKTGNTSNLQTVNVTPVDGPKVQSITLSRYHWINVDTDQTVTATAIISNAELIEDDTVVKIQAKDQNGNVINSIATLNKANGTAVATITVPQIVNETTYTVSCKIGNENADTIHTAHFNICWGASAGRISLSLDGLNYSDEMVKIPLSDVTATTKCIVRIYGSNLDLKQPSIQLYDSYDVPYFDHPIEFDTSSLQWTATTGQISNVIETEINVPAIDDLYTVRVLIDGVVCSSLSRGLQVYDIPKITNFSIPKVSITKKNSTVLAKITGINLDLPDFDLGDITAICSTNPNIVANSTFTKINNNAIQGSFTIPNNTGEYEITIRYGATSLTNILKVIDFSSYSVGDVLLNDGTIVHYNADNLNFTDEQKQKAVGVLYGFDEYDIPCGFLGIHNSNEEAQYAWAIEYTTGNNMKFSSILCDYNGMNATDATFLGDIEGSDNWANICISDPIGTTDAATNYPAFNYVNNYAKKYGLTGEYSTHWYMPCLAELCYIYRNIGIINAVIDSLGGSRIWDVWYWTSSQTLSDYYDDCAFSVRMMQQHGDIKTSYCKYNTFYVCCVRPFE